MSKQNLSLIFILDSKFFLLNQTKFIIRIQILIV